MFVRIEEQTNISLDPPLWQLCQASVQSLNKNVY